MGSSQTLAYPNMVINTSVAESFDYLATELERRRATAPDAQAAVQELVRETLAKHQRILFSGDNYSGEWEEEAARRGLLNLKNTPDALASFDKEENYAFFEKYGVLSRRETESRANVLFSAYAHRIGVEALSMFQLARTSILPGAVAYQKKLADSILATRSVSSAIDLGDQEALLAELSSGIGRTKAGIDGLTAAHREAEEQGDEPRRNALFARDRLVPAMNELRACADRLEEIVDDDVWPLPKYHELLFLH